MCHTCILVHVILWIKTFVTEGAQFALFGLALLISQAFTPKLKIMVVRLPLVLTLANIKGKSNLQKNKMKLETIN